MEQNRLIHEDFMTCLEHQIIQGLDNNQLENFNKTVKSSPKTINIA